MWILKRVLDLFGRFLFRSGNQEHPGDKIENTTVEILPVSVGEYTHGVTHMLTHTHTQGLSPLCGVMCKRVWLDYIEWLLSGTQRIDYWQECERDRMVCCARGDTSWHCDPHLQKLASVQVQLKRKIIKRFSFVSYILFYCVCVCVRKLDCRPKTSTNEQRTAFTESVSGFDSLLALSVFVHTNTQTSWSHYTLMLLTVTVSRQEMCGVLSHDLLFIFLPSISIFYL